MSTRSRTRRDPAAREPLSTDRIVAQAVRLADANGVSALSMRALAHSLGFEVMALYNHVANKRELLSRMGDAVAGEIPGPDPGARPLEAVRAIAVASHTTLLRHPWAAELWQQHLPGPARAALMESLLRLLDESVLSRELAHHGFHAVTNHVIGYTLQEVGMMRAGQDPPTGADVISPGFTRESHPHLIDHICRHGAGEAASSFDLVLDLILDGLVRLDGTG